MSAQKATKSVLTRINATWTRIRTRTSGTANNSESFIIVVYDNNIIITQKKYINIQ